MRALRRISDARSNCPVVYLQLLKGERHVTQKQSNRPNYVVFASILFRDIVVAAKLVIVRS